MVEIWKDVENFTGIYSVSNTGLIKSLSRSVKAGDKMITLKERVLKNDVGKKGYCRVTLCKESKTTRLLVHRIVASHFISNSENKPFVNHLDNNPSNNEASNLEYVTHSENMKHAQIQNRLHETQSKAGTAVGIKQTKEMYKTLEATVGKSYGCFKILSVSEERAKNSKALLNIVCTICNTEQKQNLS